ncbi:MAG: hypothetical protein WD226_09340 [Planctomycetota bacterium]
MKTTITTALRCTLGFVLVFLAGCQSYGERTNGAYRAFRNGRFDAAASAYANTRVTDSTFLSGAEAGTAALAAGDWEAALAHFERAAESAEELELRALAGPAALSEGMVSWLLNDTVQAYLGEGFERVYVHVAMGLAYLALGDLEAVSVEVRRANLLLEAEEELYEREYRAGGFGHLLSALAYELAGEYDQAWIDYERMLAKGVGTQLASRALQRLGPYLTRETELAELRERYGESTPPPGDYASIVVLAGVGLAPVKVGDVLAIPTPYGLFQMAVPRYESLRQPVTRLRLLHSESGLALDTDVVENVEEVARKNLADRLGWMRAKSAARGAAKTALTHHLGQEHGAAGAFLGILFTATTERADLRAWQTLPSSWQAARLFVPPGRSSFVLDALGGEAATLGRYSLEPGETVFVIARSIDRKLYVHVVGGSPADVDPEPERTAP